MSYFILKTVITALIIAGISELSKRFSFMAAMLASLPLTSFLAFIWIYIETKDAQKIVTMSTQVFWLVIPSLSFFAVLPVLLQHHVSFWLALLAACIATIICYGLGIIIFKHFFI